MAVDVAIPSYQYGRFLRDCVMSVVTQEIRDLRILIIDNASTDNSMEVAQQLAAEDRRVEIVAHRRNLGRHASFNEAIDWAHSKYFIILCADDLLTRGCLSRAVLFMEEHPDVHFTYGRYLCISAKDPIPQIEIRAQQANWQVLSGGEFLRRFCRAGGRVQIGPGPMSIVRTSVQKRIGYYRPQLPYCDDFEMWLRFACHGATARTDAVQVIQRNHSMMVSAAVSRDLYAGLDWDLHFEAAFESFFASEGASLPQAKHLHRTARRNLAARAYWGALSHLARGNARHSLDHWKFAFTRSPTTIFVPPLGYLFRKPGRNRVVQVLSNAVRHKPVRTDNLSPSTG